MEKVILKKQNKSILVSKLLAVQTATGREAWCCKPKKERKKETLIPCPKTPLEAWQEKQPIREPLICFMHLFPRNSDAPWYSGAYNLLLGAFCSPEVMASQLQEGICVVNIVLYCLTNLNWAFIVNLLLRFKGTVCNFDSQCGADMPSALQYQCCRLKPDKSQTYFGAKVHLEEITDASAWVPFHSFSRHDWQCLCSASNKCFKYHILGHCWPRTSPFCSSVHIPPGCCVCLRIITHLPGISSFTICTTNSCEDWSYLSIGSVAVYSWWFLQIFVIDGRDEINRILLNCSLTT